MVHGAQIALHVDAHPQTLCGANHYADLTAVHGIGNRFALVLAGAAINQRNLLTGDALLNQSFNHVMNGGEHLVSLIAFRSSRADSAGRGFTQPLLGKDDLCCPRV